MLRAPVSHWIIATVFSAPGAAILAVCIPFTGGQDPPLFLIPVTFLVIWIAWSGFAMTGPSPRSVFRRTCWTYASSAFMVPFISLAWPDPPADEGGYGFWLGLTFYRPFNTLLLFICGAGTGIIALFLGFSRITDRIPEFDYSSFTRRSR